jgi:hypothetical protein
VAFRVGVEKVIGAGIILVHASLDEAHPQHTGVKIKVLLRRTSNGRDMVKSYDGSHSRYPRPSAARPLSQMRSAFGLKERQFEIAVLVGRRLQTAAP